MMKCHSVLVEHEKLVRSVTTARRYTDADALPEPTMTTPAAKAMVPRATRSAILVAPILRIFLNISDLRSQRVAME
jgi:hypothetical protein